MDDTDSQATSCLHLVAAAGRRALRDCLARCRPDDAVLFLDAGVLHLLTGPERGGEDAAPEFLYLAADLEAHGLLAGARTAGAAIATDADMCALLARHGHCLTWT
jgi:sulfur relay protein TusB/DsrH